MKTLLKEAFLTAGAGLAALGLDASVLWTFTALFHLHYLASATLGMLAGIVVSYVLSREVIFPPSGRGRALEMGLFALVFGGGVLLNNAVMFVLVDHHGLHFMVAKGLATVMVFVWNFVLRKWVVFRPGTNQGKA